MAATRRGYALPVQGRPTDITTVRVREDPADVDSYIENSSTGRWMKDGLTASSWTGTHTT